MDIWIGRCLRPAKCSYCNEGITIGEPIVRGQLWRKKTEEGVEARTWKMLFRWHAKRKRDSQCCWLESGLEHLAKNPYVEKRGRRKLILPKEKRQARLVILRQRARLVQKLKVLMLAPDDQDIDEIIRIGSQMEEQKELIADLGGVPPKWE